MFIKNKIMKTNTPGIIFIFPVLFSSIMAIMKNEFKTKYKINLIGNYFNNCNGLYVGNNDTETLKIS